MSDPSSSRPVSVARHYSRYLSATLLTILAGFISYPMMTRLLSIPEYGVFGYFLTFSAIWVAILKLGTQHSISRLYPVYCLGHDVERRRRFYASLVVVPAVVSSGLWLVSIGALAVADHVRPVADVGYLYAVLILGQIGVLMSFSQNVIQARELSRMAATLRIVQRYLQLAVVFVVIFYFRRTAMGVYLAQMVSSLLVLLYLVRWGRRNCELGWRAFDSTIFKGGLHYGLPLALNEVWHVLMNFADRLMLRHMLDSFGPLGIYVIGSSLALYIGQILRGALMSAFMPVANRLYETEGPEAIGRLQRSVLRTLLYPAVGISIGLYWVGADFLVLLAGSDKAEAGIVFQWIGLNYVLQPMAVIATSGLLLLKRTKTYSGTAFVAAIVNIVLNWLMIPKFGIMGSVYATLLSYVVLWVLRLFACPRRLWPPMRSSDLVRPLGLGAIFFGACQTTRLFEAGLPLARLAVCAAIFVVTFAVPACLVEPDVRSAIRGKLGMASPTGRDRRAP